MAKAPQLKPSGGLPRGSPERVHHSLPTCSGDCTLGSDAGKRVFTPNPCIQATSTGLKHGNREGFDRTLRVRKGRKIAFLCNEPPIAGGEHDRFHHEWDRPIQDVDFCQRHDWESGPRGIPPFIRDVRRRWPDVSGGVAGRPLAPPVRRIKRPSFAPYHSRHNLISWAHWVSIMYPRRCRGTTHNKA